jgi:hypothetical protein
LSPCAKPSARRRRTTGSYAVERAQAIDDGPKAGEQKHLAAELWLDQLGDAAGAEAIANAVDRDPGNTRGGPPQGHLSRAGRTADCTTISDGRRRGANARPARIAELQSE